LPEGNALNADIWIINGMHTLPYFGPDSDGRPLYGSRRIAASEIELLDMSLYDTSPTISMTPDIFTSSMYFSGSTVSIEAEI